MTLKLLLFIDDRPSSQENIEEVETYLEGLKTDYTFELQIIEISKQPHLVEHFRLIATPALIKIAPGAKHTLAGSDLVTQLRKWWSQWQLSVIEENNHQHLQPLETTTSTNQDSGDMSLACSGELMRLSDDIFHLQQEKKLLLEQLKFKDQVLAMLAHDLRSPLTAASIAVETLELAQNYRDRERAEALKENLYKQIRNQFQIMNHMITDLLQTSKGIATQFEIKPQKFTLISLGEEILSNFASRLQDKSLLLKEDIPQDLPYVYADRELIRQVIVNLLDNAIKYTPEQGTISFSILHRTTQKIQISVADTGPGIPEEKREHIFEGHFRLKRDEAKEGYGLGLYLCRKVIIAHYGQIWADSVRDQGSCFHFTLPVYRE